MEKYIWQLDTTTVIIHWKMWHGKTICSILISENDFWYKIKIWDKFFKKYRIYANFDIYYKNKKISKRIWTYKDLKKIKFSKYPGVICIDEMWINANSKDSASEGNRLISQINFLARKVNCSTVFISQRFKSIPVDQRDLADLILKVKKIKTSWIPNFSITREHRISQYHKIDIGKWTRSMVESMKSRKISYNQLDTSLLT